MWQVGWVILWVCRKKMEICHRGCTLCWTLDTSAIFLSQSQSGTCPLKSAKTNLANQSEQSLAIRDFTHRMCICSLGWTKLALCPASPGLRAGADRHSCCFSASCLNLVCWVFQQQDFSCWSCLAPTAPSSQYAIFERGSTACQPPPTSVVMRHADNDCYTAEFLLQAWQRLSGCRAAQRSRDHILACPIPDDALNRTVLWEMLGFFDKTL